jgi:flagellar M-ring protein FliF
VSDNPQTAKISSLLARAKQVLAGLSRPKRVLLVTTAVAAVLIAAYFSTRSAFEPYAVLFNGLEREDSAAVVAKLKELKVPYRLSAEGAAVEVPESRVHELRLDLAGAGLPRGGAVGFESFDKLRLGATEFEQKVLYRRSLEGELARTIGSLGAVQSARVHLVLPEKSVFVSRSEPATASIVVKLRPNRALGPAEVAGIVHLTAASVPGLSADRIALVTADGAMLKKPRRQGASGVEGEAGSEEEAATARALELSLEDRVRAMLEKIVGQGHADVRVSAELDMARVERVEDHYDPAKTAVRSEEKSLERHDLEVPVAGVPGAESNLPSGTGAAKPAAGGATIRESQTRNFEVDHVMEKRTTASGAIRRLTVAVVLDGIVHGSGAQRTVVPRPQEELDKLAVLVRGAVGADDKRGDVVAVHSMAFADESATETSAVSAPEPAKSAARSATRYVPFVAASALALAALGVIWRKRRRKQEEKKSETAQLPAPVDAAPLPARPEDVRAEVLERVARDPATAALVIRGWLEAAPAAPPDAGSLAS